MFLILTILEAILIITGLFCLRKGGPVILYLLLFISIIDFINENLIVTHSMHWWKISSNVFYNIYSFFEIGCWLIIYWLAFSNNVVKAVIAILGFFILLYSMLEVFVIYEPNVFHTASFACFSLFSLFFSALYLFKINNKAYHSITADPVFWICAGATCYHAVFLVNLFTMLDPEYWQLTDALPVFHILQSVALIIYYLLICISFILFYYRRRRVITRPL